MNFQSYRLFKQSRPLSPEAEARLQMALENSLQEISLLNLAKDEEFFDCLSDILRDAGFRVEDHRTDLLAEED